MTTKIADYSKFLGCESADEKRARALREKVEAERKYFAARDALCAFEKIVGPLIEDQTIRLRRAELRRTRQLAIDEMKEAQKAHWFAEKITRPEFATSPPRYKPELDRHDGSWTKR
jgi:hypothetical protein